MITVFVNMGVFGCHLLTMNARESDDALDKAFASIASVGERVGRCTLGAYELQVFLKRNFARSPHLKEMMDAADASEDGARLHPPRRPTYDIHTRPRYTIMTTQAPKHSALWIV
jgi:hypothetical protein